VTYTNARRIAAYSWPLYATAAIGVVAGTVVALMPACAMALRAVAVVGVAAALWYSCASFFAFHAMFDRSALLSGSWLADEVAAPPRRWVEINAGLEETTVPLHEVFRETSGIMLDIYDAASMTEPAITRARRHTDRTSSLAAAPDALPVEPGWGDLVLVMLAAHEIRDSAMRERFFRELRRIVAPDGSVVLVEHLRDTAAAIAFGPGMFHFLPRQEWLRLGSLAGFALQRERAITPFVRVLVFRPAA